MKIGALIIGDELLSAKRQDKHFSHLQSVLAERGLELSWTIIVGDDAADLEHFIRFSLDSPDLVFSFGGIGATPDDRTRQSVANAAKVDLTSHPDAVAEIEAQFGSAAYPQRILMAELPKGSRIIPNTINRVPGFSFKHHHFMPGFPEMAWPMLEWVLDNHYSHLEKVVPEDEQIIYIMKGRETDLVETMRTVVEQYPALRLSSLPHLAEPSHIELSLRGTSDDVHSALTLFKQAITELGLIYSDTLNG